MIRKMPKTTPVEQMSWFSALCELIVVIMYITKLDRVEHSGNDDYAEEVKQFERPPFISRKRDLQNRLGFLRDHADEPEGA